MRGVYSCFGNEWEKKYYNVIIHCVRCISSPKSLLFKGFSFLSPFLALFWVKNGWGASIWKLSESLKARLLQPSSLFLHPACVYWFCPGVRRDALWFPPWKLWFIQGGTAFAWYRNGSWWWYMIDSLESRTWQNPSDNSRLRFWNNATRSWELSPWRQMLRKGDYVLREKKGQVKKKKKKPVLPLSLWFLRENRTVRTLGEDWRLWMMTANTFD